MDTLGALFVAFAIILAFIDLNARGDGQ